MAQHISIGIESSPAVTLRVSEDELAKLQQALSSDNGWHDIDGENGMLRVKLETVTWLKVEKDEGRVGFGLS